MKQKCQLRMDLKRVKLAILGVAETPTRPNAGFDDGLQARLYRWTTVASLFTTTASLVQGALFSQHLSPGVVLFGNPLLFPFDPVYRLLVATVALALAIRASSFPRLKEARESVRLPKLAKPLHGPNNTAIRLIAGGLRMDSACALSCLINKSAMVRALIVFAAIDFLAFGLSWVFDILEPSQLGTLIMYAPVVASFHLCLSAVPLNIVVISIGSVSRTVNRIENQMQDYYVKLCREHADNVDKVRQEHAELEERNLKALLTSASEINYAAQAGEDLVRQLMPAELLQHGAQDFVSCAVPVATTSFHALHVALATVKYLSDTLTRGNASPVEKRVERRGFEVGELVQHVADAIAGTAAEHEITLVIYHSDFRLQHINVSANEGVFRHMLLNLFKVMIKASSPGTTVELGLYVEEIGRVARNEGDEMTSEAAEAVCLHFVYKCFHGKTGKSAAAAQLDEIPDANYTAQLIQDIGGELKYEETDSGGYMLVVKVNVQKAMSNKRDVSDVTNSPSIGATPLDAFSTSSPGSMRSTSSRSSKSATFDDPGVQQLQSFVARYLKGQRALLYAAADSVFSLHLSSFLTNWGIDVMHMPVDNCPSPAVKDASNVDKPRQRKDAAVGSPNFHWPPFILIDDDIATLTSRFDELLRVEHVTTTDAGARVPGEHAPLPSHLCILYFASLAHYRDVERTVSRLLARPTLTRTPRILIIPKPAGPKRLLTSLYSAVIHPYTPTAFLPYEDEVGGCFASTSSWMLAKQFADIELVERASFETSIIPNAMDSVIFEENKALKQAIFSISDGESDKQSKESPETWPKKIFGRAFRDGMPTRVSASMPGTKRKVYVAKR